MWHGNNVNDNGSQKLKNNDNVNDRGVERSKQVDMVVDKLAQRLGAGAESRLFLCKAVWTLPEHRIWGNLEQALKGRNPMGLFIYLSKRDGV